MRRNALINNAIKNVPIKHLPIEFAPIEYTPRPLGALLVAVLLLLFAGSALSPDAASFAAVYGNYVTEGRTDTIDVGIAYGNAAPSYIQSTSNSGFRLDTPIGTARVVAYTASGEQTVTSVRIEADGMYRVELARLGGDYFAAVTLAQASARAGVIPYLRYDSGWSVVSGRFNTQGEASDAVVRIRNARIAGAQPNVQPADSNDIILMRDGIPVLSIDTSVEYALAAEPFSFAGNTFRNVWNYHGSLIVKRQGGNTMTAINRVPIEEYLYGVLPNEMSPSWPMEALKAQAVAARNYARASKNSPKFAQYGFDLDDTTASQVYLGINVEHPRSTEAVNATRGLQLFAGNQLATLYYHANSGGYTAGSEEVWGGRFSYLRATPDPYSLQAPGARWTYVVTADMLEAALNNAGLGVGRPQSVSILRRAPSGRILEMRVDGTLGSVNLSREKFRFLIGTTKIKSMMFSFDAAFAHAAPGVDFGLPGNAAATAPEPESRPTVGVSKPLSSQWTGKVSENPPSLLVRADGQIVDLRTVNDQVATIEPTSTRVTTQPTTARPVPSQPQASQPTSSRSDSTGGTTTAASSGGSGNSGGQGGQSGGANDGSGSVNPPTIAPLPLPIPPANGAVTYPETETMSFRDGQITIYGRGFGHGVGMSQWGAKIMADQGFRYDQILYFYYAGTQLR